MNMLDGELVVLVVEDTPSLHLLLSEGLEEAGFSSVVKSTGMSALEEIDEFAADYRAVVTDIRLGDDVSGWDVGRRAREKVPDMPVVYMSGDSATDWMSQGVPESIMVPKPFVMAQIITAITSLQQSKRPNSGSLNRPYHAGHSRYKLNRAGNLFLRKMLCRQTLI